MPSPGEHRPRTLTTLALAVHCCVVCVVIAANLSPSPLQLKLVSLVAPYARSLNFDPNFTRYHLTHGHIEHDDHQILVETQPSAETTPVAVELPDVGFRGSQRRRRYQLLGSRVAYFANRELDTISAEFVRAIGAHFISTLGSDRCVVTCRVHRAQPFELDRSLPADPLADAYMENIYTADVWLAEDNTIQLLKQSSERESAPTVVSEGQSP